MTTAIEIARRRWGMETADAALTPPAQPTLPEPDDGFAWQLSDDSEIWFAREARRWSVDHMSASGNSACLLVANASFAEAVTAAMTWLHRVSLTRVGVA
jgi:hypothetical protein